MDTSELIVAAGAVIAVAFVLWYFFGPRKAVAASNAGAVQEIDITVDGGYAPDVITLQAGRPARLTFYRNDTSECSERVVLRDFGIAQALPYRQRTTVEFTPGTPGEYPFVCGMNMLRGKIIVKP